MTSQTSTLTTSTTSTTTSTTPIPGSCAVPALEGVNSAECGGLMPGQNCTMYCAANYEGEPSTYYCPLVGALVLQGIVPNCTLITTTTTTVSVTTATATVT